MIAHCFILFFLCEVFVRVYVCVCVGVDTQRRVCRPAVQQPVHGRAFSGEVCHPPPLTAILPTIVAVMCAGRLV
jgi:hypothetical protein